MKLIITAYIAMCLIVPCTLIAENNVQKETPMISTLFQDISEGLKEQNLQQVMKYFSQDESDMYREIEHRISSIFAQENSEAILSIQSINTSTSPVTAIGFFESKTSRAGRRFRSAYWVTFELKNFHGKWLITNQETRDYTKPRNIELKVELLPETGEIKGTAAIAYEIVMPGETNLILSLNRGLKISRLQDSAGKTLNFDRIGRVAVIDMNREFQTGDTGEIRVDFNGSFFNEASEWGYSQVGITPQGSFASWVTGWYPMLDCETSKCPGTLSYTVPEGITVISSGLRTDQDTQDGKSVFKFKVSRPLNFSFAAADYTFLTKRINNIDIGAYFLGGDLRNAADYIETCSAMITNYIEVFGFYPYDQYCVVEIPREVTGTLGGSSEQGMNLFPEGMLSPDTMNEFVIAHEIGHSWWGNLVRGGIIQSEAMAQFSATLWFEHKYGEKALRSLLTNGYNTGSSQYGDSYLKTIATTPDSDRKLGMYLPQDASIVHQLADTKGHFVMHILRDQIGYDSFHQAIRNMLLEHAGESLTLAEFQQVFEQESEQDLTWFFDQWFYRTGAPEFNMVYKLEEAGDRYRVTGTIDQVGDFYRAKAEIGFLINGSWELNPVEILNASQEFEFFLDSQPDRVMFDPFHRLLRWRPELKYSQEIGDIQTLNAVHQSETALERTLSLLPKLEESLSGLLLLGNTYASLGRYQDAVDTYQELLQQHEQLATGIFTENLPRAILKLGNTYDLMKSRDKALEMYQAVIDYPVTIPVLHAKATSYLTTAFSVDPTYQVSSEKLAEYTGEFAVEGLIFKIWLSETGVLLARQKDSPTMTLVPKAKDEFGQVANEEIRVKFLRNDFQEISGIDVFEGGNLLVTLKKTVN